METWLNGMHSANPGLNYHWEDWVRGIVGSGGSITILDLMFRDGENGYWWERLRAECPDANIHIRCYSDADYVFEDVVRWKGRNWYDLRASDQLDAWVDEIIWRLSHVRRKTGEGQWEFLPLEQQPIMCPRVIVSASNEKDLRVEGHPLGAYEDQTGNYPYVSRQLYEEAGDFDTEWMRRYRLKVPWARNLLAAGGYAHGHNFYDPAKPGEVACWKPDDQVYPPNYEYQIPQVKRSIEACDVWIDHGYCFPNGWGSTPETEGYWFALHSLRPARYQQTEQKRLPQMGVDDPGGFCSQYPHVRVFRGEMGTGGHSDTAATEVTLSALDNIYRALSASGHYVGATPFIWNAGPEHGQASIEPNEALRNGLKEAKRYGRAALPVAGQQPAPQPQPTGETTMKIGNLEVVDLRASLPQHATDRYEIRSIGGIEYIVIHHSATPDDRSAEAIARYHVDTNGWPGIAYHFLVHQDGRTEYTQPIEIVSYGVARRNENTLHICLVGNFTDTPPGETQIKAAKALVDNLDFALGRVYPVVGHTDIAPSDYATACPGATWPQWKHRLVAPAQVVVVDWQAKCRQAQAQYDALAQDVRALAARV